ncbi:hypothetical protein EJ08DRAFT_663544 [Tothia fuscella]|uniref:Uncharacterized protein n=1 Tax=Tothia fuscella TaxID=1048955 RepID=A0A9P4NKH2_9PEZI|nr:hypothetical protein EJ08DRAFT_663544 [Tothia fuscella]
MAPLNPEAREFVPRRSAASGKLSSYEMEPSTAFNAQAAQFPGGQSLDALDEQPGGYTAYSQDFQGYSYPAKSQSSQYFPDCSYSQGYQYPQVTQQYPGNGYDYGYSGNGSKNGKKKYHKKKGKTQNGDYVPAQHYVEPRSFGPSYEQQAAYAMNLTPPAAMATYGSMPIGRDMLEASCGTESSYHPDTSFRPELSYRSAAAPSYTPSSFDPNSLGGGMAPVHDQQLPQHSRPISQKAPQPVKSKKDMEKEDKDQQKAGELQATSDLAARVEIARDAGLYKSGIPEVKPLALELEDETLAEFKTQLDNNNVGPYLSGYVKRVQQMARLTEGMLMVELRLPMTPNLSIPLRVTPGFRARGENGKVNVEDRPQYMG